MYLPLMIAVISIGLSAALVAWYYNRAFHSVRFEYLGSERSGVSGHADEIYASLTRPLRARRLIALCVATAATGIAIVMVGLQNA